MDKSWSKNNNFQENNCTYIIFDYIDLIRCGPRGQLKEHNIVNKNILKCFSTFKIYFDFSNQF